MPTPTQGPAQARLFFFFNFIYSFSAAWVFVAACGLYLVAEGFCSICGAGAQLLQWHVRFSWPGMGLVSLALAGGLLTTRPPGKSQVRLLNAVPLWLSALPVLQGL